MSAATRVRDLLAQIGGEFDEWDSWPGQLKGCVDTPPGKLWSTTGCHIIAVHHGTGRAAGWQWILDEIRQGVVDCTDPECETCVALDGHAT